MKSLNLKCTNCFKEFAVGIQLTWTKEECTVETATIMKRTFIVEDKIPNANVGHKILACMGWKECQALGATGEGKLKVPSRASYTYRVPISVSNVRYHYDRLP